MSISQIKLPKELIDIKNVDKGFTEKWTQARAKDIANIPHPSRVALIGQPSCGKSFVMKHLLMHQRPMFKELYIVHGDSAYTHEFDDLEPTMMLDEFPPIDFWDSKVKSCLFVDDFELSNASKEQIARINKTFRYVSSHKNVTIYISNQNFFELNSLIRKLCNVFVIWKPRSTTELKTIANRIGLKPEQLEYIFDNICTGHRDSLMVDFNHNSPALFRKNIFEKIDEKLINSIGKKIKSSKYTAESLDEDMNRLDVY